MKPIDLTVVVVSLMTVVSSLSFPIAGLSQSKSTTEHVEVVEAVPATYPPIAIVAKVSGNVTVRVTIASSGNVDSVAVLTGPKLLHKPAKTAAAKWVFNKSGNTNEKLRNAELHFIFEILPKGATSEELLPIFLPPFTVKVKEGLGRIDSLISSNGRGESEGEIRQKFTGMNKNGVRKKTGQVSKNGVSLAMLQFFLFDSSRSVGSIGRNLGSAMVTSGYFLAKSFE